MRSERCNNSPQGSSYGQCSGCCCMRSVARFLQLRSALHDVEEVADKDDHYFLRWLRARKFNVAQAEDMLRKVSIRSQPFGKTYIIASDDST